MIFPFSHSLRFSTKDKFVTEIKILFINNPQLEAATFYTSVQSKENKIPIKAFR